MCIKFLDSTDFLSVHPLELSDCKPEPSVRLLLAASGIVMDDLDQFPDYRLDILHFDRTIATARVQSDNSKGCRCLGPATSVQLINHIPRPTGALNSAVAH
jgi:hypothetical protein